MLLHIYTLNMQLGNAKGKVTDLCIGEKHLVPPWLCEQYDTLVFGSVDGSKQMETDNQEMSVKESVRMSLASHLSLLHWDSYVGPSL